MRKSDRENRIEFSRSFGRIRFREEINGSSVSIQMKENAIRDKSYAFALNITELKNILFKNKEFVISNQIMRSGTEVGALVREAQHAESKNDFIHKLSIALKEANETKYLLELLDNSQLIEPTNLHSLHFQCEELINLMVSIIKTTKMNLKRANQ